MIYKRGDLYWYKFMWQGKLIRESSKQGNDKVARNMKSAHRTSLAKGEVGLRDKKPAPTLSEFIDGRFEPWARATFENTSLKTWRDFYKVGIRTIKEYKPLASLRLDEVTSEKAAEFAAYRQSQGRMVSTVNSSLRVLRRILGLAVEWGVLQSAPKVKKLPGERHREHVVTLDEEENTSALLSSRWVPSRQSSLIQDCGPRNASDCAGSQSHGAMDGMERSL